MSFHFFGNGLLNIESKGIAAPALILAVSSVASRSLGILRDWLLAQRFGAGPDLDVYYAAFRAPDFVYNLLVFGGITVAFLPLFSDYFQKSKDEAWRFAANLLNIFSFFLILAGIAGFVFAPALAAVVAPGFSPAQLEQTAALMRVMFLSPIIFGAASVFSGILQYFKRFLAYGLAAPLYNLGIIAGIVFLAPAMGIMGVAAGVIAGALAYLLVQIAPAIKSGFVWRPIFDFKDPALARAVALILPRVAGIAANQINLIAPVVIASSLAAGSIAVFNLANNIFSLPAGIIGVSYATAAFALFSKYAAEGRAADLAQKFSQTMRQVGFFTVPAAILIFLIRDPLVRFLYQRGEFTAEAASLTAAALGIFCLGIYFSSALPLMFRLFFALRDTFLPTLSTIIAVAANLAMNIWFVFALRQELWDDFVRRWFDLPAGDIAVLGLPLAYGLANVLQFFVLWFFLFKKNRVLGVSGEIARSLGKTALAGIFMGIVVYWTIDIIGGIAGQNNLMVLALAGTAAVIAYAAAATALKIPEAAMFWRALNVKKQ